MSPFAWVLIGIGGIVVLSFLVVVVGAAVVAAGRADERADEQQAAIGSASPRLRRLGAVDRRRGSDPRRGDRRHGVGRRSAAAGSARDRRASIEDASGPYVVPRIAS